MATVTKIPATVSRFTAAPIAEKTKRKVAAYARVSTDHEDQQNSYEAQCDYYTTYIQGNDEWEFAGVYSEEERSYPALFCLNTKSWGLFVAGIICTCCAVA